MSLPPADWPQTTWHRIERSGALFAVGCLGFWLLARPIVRGDELCAVLREALRVAVRIVPAILVNLPCRLQ